MWHLRFANPAAFYLDACRQMGLDFDSGSSSSGKQQVTKLEELPCIFLPLTALPDHHCRMLALISCREMGLVASATITAAFTPRTTW
jgi:hypothetical protein